MTAQVQIAISVTNTFTPDEWIFFLQAIDCNVVVKQKKQTQKIFLPDAKYLEDQFLKKHRARKQHSKQAKLA